MHGGMHHKLVECGHESPSDVRTRCIRGVLAHHCRGVCLLCSRTAAYLWWRVERHFQSFKELVRHGRSRTEYRVAFVAYRYFCRQVFHSRSSIAELENLLFCDADRWLAALHLVVRGDGLAQPARIPGGLLGALPDRHLGGSDVFLHCGYG